MERFKVNLISGVALGALGSTALFNGLAHAQSGPPTTAVGGAIQEVVVTASKRAETVKDTPSSITALTGATLQNLGIQDFADYKAYIPDLADSGNAAAGHGGAPGTGAIVLRGLNTGAEQGSSTVGFYIDETPFTPSAGGFPSTLISPDPDLGDVQRLEVLKGPQSTLYGASTLGGLIRVISNVPDLKNYFGSVRLAGSTVDGGGSGGGIHVSANVPIVSDLAAVNFSAFGREDPGYVDNVETGQKNVNRDDVDGARATLRLDPTDRLDITLSGYFQENHAFGTDQEDLKQGTLIPTYGRYKYSSFLNPNIDTKYNIVNNTVSYKLDAGTITQSLSYGHYKSVDSYDFSNGYAILFKLYGEPDPNAAMLAVLHPQMDKLTEDIRFNSRRFGPIEFQMGIFYTHENDQYGPVLNGLDGVTKAPLAPPFFNVINALNKSRYTEYAIYGDITYHFTPKLDATFGLRESYNEQHGVSVSSGLLASATSLAAETSKSEDSDTSYLFDVRWRPSEAISAYVRIASAYRPGGPQFSPIPSVPSSFAPDTVWNYEVGAKGRWFNGSLTADTAIYHIDWTNIQLNSLIGGLAVTGNGGDAESNGLEFQGQWRPIRALTLGLSGAYDQTRIDKVASTVSPGPVVGDPLPYTPKWSGAFTADYQVSLAPALLTLGGSYIYQGSRQSSFSADPLNTDLKLPSYNYLNLRSRIDWNNYSLIFRIDNVTGSYGIAGENIPKIVAFDTIPGVGIPIQPRTFKVSVEAKF